MARLLPYRRRTFSRVEILFAFLALTGLGLIGGCAPGGDREGALANAAGGTKNDADVTVVAVRPSVEPDAMAPSARVKPSAIAARGASHP